MRNAMPRSSCQASRTLSLGAPIRRRFFRVAKNPYELRTSCIHGAHSMPSACCAARRARALLATADSRRIRPSTGAKNFFGQLRGIASSTTRSRSESRESPETDSHSHRLVRPRRGSTRAKMDAEASATRPLRGRFEPANDASTPLSVRHTAFVTRRKPEWRRSSGRHDRLRR